MTTVKDETGEWQESGFRNVPVGVIEWHHFKHAHVAMLGKMTLAVVRHVVGYGAWTAKMPGWLWAVTPDMPAARFGLKQVTVKGFKTHQQAIKAIESAYATLCKAKEGGLQDE